jgi:hypothetical protein
MMTYVVYFNRLGGFNSSVGHFYVSDTETNFWDRVALNSGRTIYRLPYVIRCKLKDQRP